jgi:hypothetical protein
MDDVSFNGSVKVIGATKKHGIYLDGAVFKNARSAVGINSLLIQEVTPSSEGVDKIREPRVDRIPEPQEAPLLAALDRYDLSPYDAAATDELSGDSFDNNPDKNSKPERVIIIAKNATWDNTTKWANPALYTPIEYKCKSQD